MKAIYQDKVFHLNDDETMTEIWPKEKRKPIPVPYGHEDLIIDPTDGQLYDVGYLKKEDLR
jgi:hypothetical protein